MPAAAPLEGKRIFITGATSGFGNAFARCFHAAGAHVIASGRRRERLIALQAELGAERLHVASLDVRDHAQVAQCFAALPSDFNALDVLVNNAGLALGLGRAPDIALADWEQMIDANIKGTLYCTHAALPGMIARGRGHIVNIGSVAGHYPYPGGNVYGATKAFIAQFSLNLRADLLGSNVRVTVIEPGMAETEFSQVRLKGDKNAAKAIYEGTKSLSADDVASALLYCLTAPPHVNVNRLELMPVGQAFAGFSVHRD